MYHMCAFLWRSEEDVGLPRTRATESCELPWEFWDLIIGLLQQKTLFLITAASLQPLERIIYIVARLDAILKMMY